MTEGRQIPEMIIVAITNIDRVRDFTPTKYLTNLNGSSAVDNHKTSGGSEQFLQFIEKELLPEIESTYRTTTFKTLVGISHGGLLVGSAFLSKKTSFNGFKTKKSIASRLEKRVAEYIKRKGIEIEFENEFWKPPAYNTPPKLTRIYLIPNAKMAKNHALDKIKELKEYLEMGIITQEDFDRKAAELKKIFLGN